MGITCILDSLICKLTYLYISTFTHDTASHTAVDPAIARCFPEEEISNMRSELDKYGIQMPTFSKIGGILANELSVDEAARKSFIRWLNVC